MVRAKKTDGSKVRKVRKSSGAGRAKTGGTKTVKKAKKVRDPAKKRSFILYDPKTMTPTGQKFTGRTPGQAAKKAATRGIREIVLRETGQRKVKKYTGFEVMQVMITPNSKWMQNAAKNMSYDEAMKFVNSEGAVCNKGKNPDAWEGDKKVYVAKIGKTKYIGTEPLPAGTPMTKED